MHSAPWRFRCRTKSPFDDYIQLFGAFEIQFSHYYILMPNKTHALWTGPPTGGGQRKWAGAPPICKAKMQIIFNFL